MIFYPITGDVGLDLAKSNGDGYSVSLTWFRAYSSVDGYVGYNIYFSTEKENVFSEGPKYFSFDNSLTADIVYLTPGQLYYFAVRPIEYDPVYVNISALPEVSGLKTYPEDILRQAISDTDLVIPLVDVGSFPDYGIVKVGVELIRYLSVDRANNNLVLSDLSDRGFYGTKPAIHHPDGYDGYYVWNSAVTYSLGKESTKFDRIYPCQSRFDIPYSSFTELDGYKQIPKDLLTSDLSGSDAYNEDFNSYDYNGWHRTDPLKIISGECVGSYMSGEQFCADGYSGVGRMLRGISLQERILQRQEMLLSITGEPVCLLRRVRTGIICKCITPTNDYPDDRCPYCFGGKFVLSYEQYFNPRRSDGRIMVRFSPADEDVKMQDAGLESELTTDCWTMTVPTIKDRDILIRFDQEDNEEFRYEVLSVNRNRTALRLESAQRMRVQRIRKYDKAYQITALRDTSTMPEKVQTGITNARGIGPHIHDIVSTNQPINKLNQLTSVNFGHNHIVFWNPATNKLEVKESLGHTHEINI